MGCPGTWKQVDGATNVLDLFAARNAVYWETLTAWGEGAFYEHTSGKTVFVVLLCPDFGAKSTLDLFGARNAG